MFDPGANSNSLPKSSPKPHRHQHIVLQVQGHFNSSLSEAEDTASTLPRAPVLPVDIKSSGDRPLVAVADILNTSDPMLASLLIIMQACIPNTGSEVGE